uniref:Uncharacterized protein n=1 Tax=Timema bartmani TaxID=61472 RepID=A0A7R9FEI5_9NEOP|nr:unnamed protein product [Timema bartmani]
MFTAGQMWEFLGSLIITTALSALLSLVFESPIISIEKALLEKEGSGNEKLEGVTTMFVFEDKLHAFMCKSGLWIGKVQEINYSVFPKLKALSDNKSYTTITEEVQHNVLCHLQILKDEFTLRTKTRPQSSKNYQHETKQSDTSENINLPDL